MRVGCEAIVHAVSQTLEDEGLSPDSCHVLLLDFSNAFNSIDRSHMFSEVRARIPSLSSWVESCYSSQPILHFGKHTILSRCGVQQGDPLGPLCFALTLHPIVERLKRDVPNLLIDAWYLDDGTLCGTAEDLAKALAIIEEDGPPRGLRLNRSKSLHYIPEDADGSHNPLPPEIPITRSGFSLLGSPIGPASFCESIAAKRVEKIRSAVTKLRDLEDSQIQSTLLHSCLALPKLNFLLRSCPPVYIHQATMAFDNMMRECLFELAGGPLSKWAWQKASLPSSLGGLNIRSASLHAPAAFVSSPDQSRALISRIRNQPSFSSHLARAVSDLALAAERPDWSSVEEIDVPLRQRPLSRMIDEASYNSLLHLAPDTRSRALALSTAIPHAGDWLNVIPAPALGLHLHDREFRCCLDYWLGLEVFSGNSRCPACSKEGIMDPFGDHQVGCGGNGDRIYRHNALRDVLFSAAQSAALAPRKEVTSLIPDTNSRPADIFLPNWSRGLPAALDVTVISTLQTSTLSGAAKDQGYALRVGEGRKIAAHQEACQAVGMSFVPLVVESLGGWSEEAALTISRIGRLLGQRTGSSPGETTRHLFQRLSVALWRGNATLWLNCLPTHSPWVDGII